MCIVIDFETGKAIKLQQPVIVDQKEEEPQYDYLAANPIRKGIFRSVEMLIPISGLEDTAQYLEALAISIRKREMCLGGK